MPADSATKHVVIRKGRIFPEAERAPGVSDAPGRDIDSQCLGGGIDGGNNRREGDDREAALGRFQPPYYDTRYGPPRRIDEEPFYLADDLAAGVPDQTTPKRPAPAGGSRQTQKPQR